MTGILVSSDGVKKNVCTMSVVIEDMFHKNKICSETMYNEAAFSVIIWGCIPVAIFLFNFYCDTVGEDAFLLPRNKTH
jgi:hypothetical protein